MTFTIETKDEKETLWLAEKLGRLTAPQDVILLEGDLGAGKTTFTKGLAKGMGIPSVVKSPTYTIIREYTKGRIPLYHMDVYRLEGIGGEELGLEEYFYGDGVSVVEWSAFVEEELPRQFLKIKLEPSGELLERRRLTFEPHGSRYLYLLTEFKDTLTTEQTGGIQ